MFDFLMALMAVTAHAVDADTPRSQAPEVEQAETQTAPQSQSSVIVGENTTIGEGVVIGGSALLEGTNDTATAAPAPAPATPGINQAVIPAGLVAEPQTPSGKFTTAAEIRPIMDATKGSWVAVREYDGKDLLYVTHLWSWRCGLAAMAISVNDEPMQNWPLPECHLEYASPNAILDEDGLPFLTLRLGSVEKISIQVVYDDLSVDVAHFARSDVLIP